MREKFSDFHIHSHYSDGVLSPIEIVDRYEKNGYKIISITDHDTILGSQIAYEYARDREIDVISGIEMSTISNEGYEVHILGYYIDYFSKALNSAISLLDSYRNERNEALAKELNELGYEISTEEVRGLNKGRFVGKPNIARLLMKKGYINSVEEAFDVIFKREEIKSIKKKVFRTEDAINVIHEAGGIAILAHPMEMISKNEEREEFQKRLNIFLNEMIEMRVDGIECFHPSASDDDSKMLREYAILNNLIITGGSDFHSDSDRRFKDEN